MSSKTWTLKADWDGFSSRTQTPIIDRATVANSIVLAKPRFVTDFEEYAVGAQPTLDWTATGADTVIANDQSNSATKSFKFTGTSAPHLNLEFGAVDEISVQFYIRAHQTNMRYRVEPTSTVGAGYKYCGFELGADGHFKKNVGTSAANFSTDTTYSADTWYKIKITCKASTNHFRIYINDVKKHDGVCTTSQANFDWLWMYWHGAGTEVAWIDDLQIWYTYDSAAPSYLSPSTINYQYDAGSSQAWTSFNFNGTKPANTNLRFRFKTAATQGDLAAAGWSGYYTAAGALTDVANGRWIEAQVELSTTDTSVTPQLDDLTVSYGAAPVISGTIRNVNGEAVAGVTVAYSGTTSGSVTTNASGVYSITTTETGTYTVTPTPANSYFSPTNIVITNITTDQTNQNFTDYTATTLLKRTYTFVKSLIQKVEEIVLYKVRTISDAVVHGDITIDGSVTANTLAGIIKGTAGVLSAITAGTANQVLGMNAAANAYEYKSIVGTSNQVTVTHTANTVTLAGPQDLHTTATPTFAGLTVSGALLTASPTAGVGVKVGSSANYGVKVGGTGHRAIANSSSAQFLDFTGSAQLIVIYAYNSGANACVYSGYPSYITILASQTASPITSFTTGTPTPTANQVSFVYSGGGLKIYCGSSAGDDFYVVGYGAQF